MREIKFRAWDEYQNKLEYFEFPIDAESIAEYHSTKLPTHKRVWMQFTGLFDRNKKEIYEGDVVKPVQTKGMRWKVATVEYQRGEFVIVPKGATLSFKTLTETGWRKIEVIGNCYENSDLIQIV